jgi:cytochrome P450
MFRKRRVELTAPHTYALRLSADEREAISYLVPQLRQLLEDAGPNDPRLRRLFPTTYTTDPEAEAEYRRLMRDDLIKSRLSSLEIVETNIQATSLSEGDMVRWMQAINDARLVLGTILDVSEDDDRFQLDEDDPQAQAFNLFHYLGGLLDDIVTALSPS